MYSEYFQNHPMYDSLEHYIISIIDEGGGSLTERNIYDSIIDFHRDPMPPFKIPKGSPKPPSRKLVKQILKAFEKEGKIVKNSEGEYDITNLGFGEVVDFTKSEITHERSRTGYYDPDNPDTHGDMKFYRND